MKSVLEFLERRDLTVYTYNDSARCRQIVISQESGLFKGEGETIFLAAVHAMENAEEKQ